MVWRMPSAHSTGKGQARIVRLFRKGRDQEIRIHQDLELEGEEAMLRRDGDRLIIEPIRRDGLLDIDFPDVDVDLGDVETIES